MFRGIAEAGSGARPTSTVAVCSFAVKGSASISSCARLDKLGSTNSAVGDAAQDVFHLAGSQLSVDCSHGCETAEGTIGMLEPAHGTLVVAEIFISNRYNSSQSVKPVGFVTCQSSLRRRRCKLRGERSSALASSFRVNPEARINSFTTAGGKPSRIASRISRSLERARPRVCSPPNSSTTARSSFTICHL